MDDEAGAWEFVPDPIFLQLTGYLSVQDVLNMSATCKSWFQMAQDDYLWKRLFRRDFKVSPNIGLKPGTILKFIQSALLFAATSSPFLDLGLGVRPRIASEFDSQLIPSAFRCQIVEERIRTTDQPHPNGQDGRVERARAPGTARQLLAQWKTVCHLFQGRIGYCK